MVVKMAKIMKSRRLRKRVRKTLGALFLASAIAVAAIPVDGLQASGESEGDLVVTVGDTESGIPILRSDEKVYATGDGVFQFAYVSDDSSNPHDGTRNAVIVGYNPPTNLEYFGYTKRGGGIRSVYVQFRIGRKRICSCGQSR